ncbi:MAG: type II toxin-antitoxin system death-on-curing family toxin [Betaproteobacteria bacterium]|nr:type II toxin-antitoxin system death-on-curing family toxin [Betaproteobacteria bacterium]
MARKRKWLWISKAALPLLHGEALAEHGGASGIRDEGLFESALARPENLAAYEDPDFAALAAAYGIGLAKNHAFVDGNKRVAFIAVGLFLALNGYRLTASQIDATQTMLAVAAGNLSETEFAGWIRGNSEKR